MIYCLVKAGQLSIILDFDILIENGSRAFRLVARSSFVFASSNCDWLL